MTAKKTNSFATRCPHCKELISFRDQKWELYYDAEENIRSAVVDAAYKYHVGGGNYGNTHSKRHVLEAEDQD